MITEANYPTEGKLLVHMRSYRFEERDVITQILTA